MPMACGARAPLDALIRSTVHAASETTRPAFASSTWAASSRGCARSIRTTQRRAALVAITRRGPPRSRPPRATVSGATAAPITGRARRECGRWRRPAWWECACVRNTHAFPHQSSLIHEYPARCPPTSRRVGLALPIVIPSFQTCTS